MNKTFIYYQRWKFQKIQNPKLSLPYQFSAYSLFLSFVDLIKFILSFQSDMNSTMPKHKTQPREAFSTNLPHHLLDSLKYCSSNIDQIFAESNTMQTEEFKSRQKSKSPFLSKKYSNKKQSRDNENFRQYLEEKKKKREEMKYSSGISTKKLLTTSNELTVNQIVLPYQKKENYNANSRLKPFQKPKSPKKSPPPLKFSLSFAKHNHIDKYFRSPQKDESKDKKKKRKIKSKSPITQKQKYSHPGLSLNKRKGEVRWVEELCHEKPLTREQFLFKMKNHCYVRHFMNDQELNTTYNELILRRVSSLEWEKKVIEKIFTKIRKGDIL